MNLKHYWVAVAFLCFYSSSYSEIKNDISKNAAAALSWSMQNILPYSTGLTVDGVIYQYTAVKNTVDPMGVTIQNKNTTDNSYVFRNKDDWTGLRGNTITKVIPVDNIPGNLWGDGEIKIDGIGSVINQSVVYKYRYDTCIINPLSSPTCPGYAAAMARMVKTDDIKIDIINQQDTNNVSSLLCLPTDIFCLENKTEKQDIQKDKKNSIDNKKQAINGLVSSTDAMIASQLEMMSSIPEIYKTVLQGGVYKDVSGYAEKKLPDSKDAKRFGLAQERLHQTMVDSQYEIK